MKPSGSLVPTSSQAVPGTGVSDQFPSSHPLWGELVGTGTEDVKKAATSSRGFRIAKAP